MQLFFLVIFLGWVQSISNWSQHNKILRRSIWFYPLWYQVKYRQPLLRKSEHLSLNKFAPCNEYSPPPILQKGERLTFLVFQFSFFKSQFCLRYEDAYKTRYTFAQGSLQIQRKQTLSYATLGAHRFTQHTFYHNRLRRPPIHTTRFLICDEGSSQIYTLQFICQSAAHVMR